MHSTLYIFASNKNNKASEHANLDCLNKQIIYIEHENKANDM